MKGIKQFSIHKGYNAIITSILFVLASILNGYGQNKPADTAGVSNDTNKKKLVLFENEDLLEVSLKFDVTTFLKKSQKTGSLDGMLIIPLSETDTIDRKVKIKYRGEYRFQTCSFPPIMLNFKKLFPAYSDTGKIKKLKLVTHCMPGSNSDDNVLREYLVYRLYNVLTDTSYRVKLVRITYIDTQNKRKPITQYGFFIEPIEIVALRTKSSVVKATNLTQKHIVPTVMDRVAIFFYMISQWDWSVPGLHNVSVIVPFNHANTGLGVAIPYDFDLSGVVNPAYGFPDPAMGITSNRDRKFAGICRSREEFIEDLIKFRDLKGSFYSVINDFPYLSQKSKKDITSFLDSFFDQLNSQKDMERLIGDFINSCKPL